MQIYIVNEGDAAPIDRDNLPPRDNYGRDWIAVEAVSEDDAIHQAWQFDHDTHPATTEMELFAVLYRKGKAEL